MYTYTNVFVAGTFDGLHKGHEAVLQTAFTWGEHVTVGLTSDAFIKTYKKNASSSLITPFSVRKTRLEAWLDKNGYTNRAVIIPIDNPYEPATSSEEVDALIVTPDNRKTGEEINSRRQERSTRDNIKLSELHLIDVPIVPAEDGRAISSTRLRNKEIDQNGKLIMPESLRSLLWRPLGRVLTSDEEIKASLEHYSSGVIMTVGDASCEQCLSHGIIPNLAIIDQKIARTPHNTLASFPRDAHITKQTIVSGPGFISQESVVGIQSIVQQSSLVNEHHVLIVDGEEDLLLLPVVQYAAHGTVVYYGQPYLTMGTNDGPKSGLVEVIVCDEVKETVDRYLGQFITS